MHNRTPTSQELWQQFRTHLLIFVIVNVGLITLNLTRNPEKHWFIWPLIGWGAGLALHALLVFRRTRHSSSSSS